MLKSCILSAKRIWKIWLAHACDIACPSHNFFYQASNCRIDWYTYVCINFFRGLYEDPLIERIGLLPLTMTRCGFDTPWPTWFLALHRYSPLLPSWTPRIINVLSVMKILLSLISLSWKINIIQLYHIILLTNYREEITLAILGNIKNIWKKFPRENVTLHYVFHYCLGNISVLDFSFLQGK